MTIVLYAESPSEFTQLRAEQKKLGFHPNVKIKMLNKKRRCKKVERSR